jgi:hypothetical protein
MERELWEQLYAIVVPLDRFWTNGFYRNWEVVLVFLWAVVHDNQHQSGIAPTMRTKR